MFHRLLRPVRRFHRFAFRLLAYLPVIWRDEDWDYSYLLQLLQFKISRLRRSMVHVEAPNQVRRMRIVELLIGRLVDGDYCRYEHDEWLKDGMSDQRFHDMVRQTVYLEDQDWNMVWDIIKKHGRRWWD